MREAHNFRSAARPVCGHVAHAAHRVHHTARDEPYRRHRWLLLCAAVLACYALLTARAAAQPTEVFVSSYVHDGITVFDGVEHTHPFDSFEQFIEALSGPTWTVDIWSSPSDLKSWQYELTIDYSNFGLPSYISFPYLDLNIDVFGDEDAPITDFILVNGAGVALDLEHGVIVGDNRIETMIRRGDVPFDNILTIMWNQGPPPAELTDIDALPDPVNLTDTFQTQQLTVTGFFDDGTQADLTGSATGTTYASNAQHVAAVTSEGLVIAVWAGSTVITVDNKGITDQVTVDVADGSYPVDADGDGQITAADLCAWLDNPIDLNGDGVADDDDYDLILALLPDPVQDCNSNGVPDACDILNGDADDCNANGIPDGCEADCNGSGQPDTCDIADGTSEDCNSNGIPDECDIGFGAPDIDGNGVPDECQPDCNNNDVPDSWDIFIGASEDCNGDGVPDECGDDCNTNGIADECEIADGIEEDCNGNTVPDSCDIADGDSDDSNGNGIPDECEADCNNNGIPDAFDIAKGTSDDCNANGVPDECEPDCNANGVPDACDIADGDSEDCNVNGVPDACDVAGGASDDANGNEIPDECEADCNSNGIPDDLDILSGFSADCDDNGVPDECDPDCNGNGIPDACEGVEELASITPDGPPAGSSSDNIALSGDIAVLGSYLDDDNGSNAGAAYVFRRNGSNFTQEAKLLASDGAAGDQFGRAIAVSDNIIVVGARLHDADGSSAGAAYVFRHDGSAWNQEAKLIGTGVEAGDRFGVSVAISSNTIIVGAERDNDNGDNAGAAYIYQYIAGTWTETAKLLAADGAPGDRFGDVVAVSGDYALVGAWGQDPAGAESGAAYIFHRVAGAWSQQAKLVPADAQLGDQFGRSVALDGDRAIIGAWRDDDAAPNAGSAYIFSNTGGNWIEKTKLLADDAVTGDGFAWSVAISGDHALVGAFGNDDLGDSAGSAYLYRFDGVHWNQADLLLASNGKASDNFGNSVGIEDMIALVGAPGGSAVNAYVFSVTTFADCNDNGVPDECDIDSGNSQDTDGNGIPDECEPDVNSHDLNGDGAVDVFDMLELLGNWGTCPQPCPPSCVYDFTGPFSESDCNVDVFDLMDLIQNWSG